MGEESTIVADAHVHIYPFYDLPFALQGGIENLKALSCRLTQDGASQHAYMVWLLAERYDCNFFEKLKEKGSGLKRYGFSVYRSGEKEALIVETSENATLFIIAGRQVVTRERLEILSFFSNTLWEDRKYSVYEILQRVKDSGGIPAINWAPGKWFFKRGRLVEDVIENCTSKDLFICDTSLRNTLWPVPRLMVKAKKRGLKVVAGSDPLPFEGEERYIGAYGTLLKGRFDAGRPAASLRALFRDTADIKLLGKRNSPITFCRRQYKIMKYQNKKQ